MHGLYLGKECGKYSNFNKKKPKVSNFRESLEYGSVWNLPVFLTPDLWWGNPSLYFNKEVFNLKR